MGKGFLKTISQLRMALKKAQKQVRDERTQEDHPTSAKIHSSCRVVFLRYSISALLSGPSLTENEHLEELFSLVSVFFQGVSKPPSK